ncbi:MAG TPA: hypothetical protein VGU63_03940 [Candidatus Acidoferrales bacterium]|nr:hypothetical protein [Candidatus Acidoferrales bacterium]
MSSEHNRNLSDRMVEIIESEADAFTKGTVRNLQNSALTPSYHNLPHDELYSRVYKVYSNLGRWLWEKSNESIRAWYWELGEKRFKENVPLSEVLWALVLTKDRLIQYLDQSGLVNSAMELYQQKEFDRLIVHFFDRAICYAAEGYQRSEPELTKSAHEPSTLGLLRRFWLQSSSTHL